MKLLLSVEFLQQVEILWERLVDTTRNSLSEEEYKQFHKVLYFLLLDIEDITIFTATMGFSQDDFYFDSRGTVSVSFGSFAMCMLELADNWTNSRDPKDYAAFMNHILEKYPVKVETTNEQSNSFSLNKGTYFSGGVIISRTVSNSIEYSKAPNPPS